MEQYHAIAFEGLVQNDTAQYVHHLVLTAWTGTPDCGLSCEEWLFTNFPDLLTTTDDDAASSPSSFNTSSSPSSSFNTSSSPSSASSSPSYTSYYSYFEENNITVPDFCYYDNADVFPWAPGSADIYLPDDIGFLFGNASGGYTSLSLETHYDNPNGDAGKNDSSGVRVYYTEEIRPIEMGVRERPRSCLLFG